MSPRNLILTAGFISLQLAINSAAQSINSQDSTRSIAPQEAARHVIEPFPITTHPEADIMPALSPDGRWVAYVSRQNKNYDIWVKSVFGGLASALTTNTSDDYSPAWSPDGKRLVFVSRRDDAQGDLYSLEIKFRDGYLAPRDLKRLTENIDRESYPAFSPDGKRIAYSVGASGSEQIHILELKTQKSYELTENGGSQPAWSPDGKWLAISAPTHEASRRAIFLIPSDTTTAEAQRVQLTHEGENLFPMWSPDGKSLLIQRVNERTGLEETRSHLRILKLDNFVVAPSGAGRAQDHETLNDSRSLHDSNDGVPKGTTTKDGAPEGTTTKTITKTTTKELPITPEAENAVFPFWGKDGSIFYAADHYGNLDLWRLPANGRIPRFEQPRNLFEFANSLDESSLALLAFESLRFHFPDSIEWSSIAGVEIGKRHLALHDTAAARDAFEEVLHVHSHSEAAGLAEIELAKLSPSNLGFDAIRKRYEGMRSIQAYCLLESGRLLQREGKLSAALQNYQRIISEFAGEHDAVYQALLSTSEVFLALREVSESEENLVQIVTQFPERPDWRHTAITRLLDSAPSLETVSDTLASYQLLIQKYRAHPAIANSAQMRIAERLEREGETKLAANEYQTIVAMTKGSDDPYLRDLRGRAMLQLLRLNLKDQEVPAATQIFVEMQKEFATADHGALEQARRELVEALVQRGRVLARAQDYELALSLFLQARQYDPSNVEAHRGCVENLYALDRIDEAVAEYTRLTEQRPNDPVALYILGLAYSYKAGNDIGTLRHSSKLIEKALAINYRMVPAYLTLSFDYEGIELLMQKERERKKGFFEKISLALPYWLDDLRRTITFRPPKQPERWYEKAIEALTIAIALNDENDDPQREAALALNLANNYYNLGEFGFENAFRYYLIKLKHDSSFVNTRQKAIVLERAGQCGWAIGQSEPAIGFLRQSVDSYRALRDVDGELRTLQRLALLYQQRGDFEESMEYFREVIQVGRRENRSKFLSRTLRNMAYNHQQVAERDEAIAKSGQAFQLIQEEGTAGFARASKSRFFIRFLGLPIFWMTVDPVGESSTEGLTYEQEKTLIFSIIGESHLSGKEFSEALASIEEKAGSFRRRKNHLGEAVALNNLGNLWYNLHEFDKAWQNFQASYEVCDRHDLKPGKIINLINLGNLALLSHRQGDPSKARFHTVDSLLQAARDDAEQVATHAPRQKLAIMNALGNLHYFSAQRILADRSAQGDVAETSSNGVREATITHGIEETLNALRDISFARAYYDSALVMAQSYRMDREEIIVRRNLACAHFLAGDYAPGLEQLLAGHELSVRKNHADLSWRVKHALGTACRIHPFPQDHPLASLSPLDWYFDAIRILEEMPEEPEGIEQRIVELEEQHELYQNTVSLLAEQGESLKALELAERGRANQFVNLAATRYIFPKKQRHLLIWGGGGGEAPHLQRIITRLRGELRRLEAEDPQRPKELAAVRDELASAERDYQDVVKKALAEDPELASFFSVQPFEVAALRDFLDERTAIVCYFVAQDQLIIWIVSHDRLEHVRVPVARTVLRHLVGKARNSTFMSSAIAQLSSLLLGKISGLEDFARVIIVPDDCLHYLPFAPLLYQGDPLIDQFTLSSVPSLLALRFADGHKNLNDDNLLVVSNAAEGASALQDSTSLSVKVLRGEEWCFAETPARQQLQQAGMIHLEHEFVAHADRPLDSGFLVRPAEPEAQQTFFPLYRCFELDLNTSLVVLAGTSFPYEADQTGEEMIALERSLIYAGAPALVLCHWAVPEEMRREFFRAFYAHLADRSFAEAFATAQLALRERHPNSNDWAAFELIGIPGLSPEQKKEFAGQHFFNTVRRGNESQEIDAFADAVRYYQSALTMARQLGQQEDMQRLYLLIKDSAISGKDFETACEIESEILKAAIAANDVKQQAQSYRNLSVWQLQRKDYPAALEAEQSYLALAERFNNPLAAAHSRVQLAQIQEAAGDYAAALSNATHAAATFAEHKQTLPRLRTETLLGKLALEDDRYGEAERYFENAIKNFVTEADTSALTATERRPLGTAYQLLGVVYSRLTAYRQALTFHQAGRDLFASIADSVNLARAEQYMADTYWLNGDYQKALFHQQRSLKLSEPLADEKLKILGQTTLGMIMLSLGDFERALDAEKQALELALQLEETAGAEALREQATIHKNIGSVYVQQRELQKALASFSTAAEIDRQVAYERGLLYDYLNLGQVQQALAQYDSAFKAIAAAETLAVKLDDPRAHAKALYAKGQALLARGNKALAGSAFNQALAKSEEIMLDELQWRCLWQLGALAHQNGELETSLDFYQRAIAAIERLSAKIKIEEFRSGFIDNKMEIYEEAVLLLLQMKREGEAFIMAERAKSRSFADMLGNSGSDWQAGADRLLLERRDNLLDAISLMQGKLSGLQQRPDEPQARNAIANLNDSLAVLQRRYGDLLVEIKAANPELADAVSVDPLPLAEVQLMLGDSVALAEYFFAKDRLICWVVDRSQTRSVSTPLDRKRLSDSVVQLRKAIQKRASTEGFSRELYDMLVKPVEPMLVNVRQLVIVPHGILHYLPFAALQRADGAYLIDQHALALAPSATVLGFCQRKASSHSRAEEQYRVLALGNPDVGNPRLDLPFAEKEIKSLEQTFDEIESFTRQQATKAALIPSSGEADLIHFSCHGIYDDRNPLFSALLLAPDASNPDGRLEAHEIFTLKLNSELVMLSACETGLARVTGGDEVIGLARSFIFAGAPSLIASLWTVDDLATAITVKRFYRYLKAGMTKAQALREAQRFVRDNHNAHPAYWASFGLTGSWQ